MLKKQRLTAMEGKFHDKKPKYSRKGRQQMKVNNDLVGLLVRIGGEENMRMRCMDIIHAVLRGEHSGDFNKILESMRKINLDG